jgi:hypothetical protein
MSKLSLRIFFFLLFTALLNNCFSQQTFQRLYGGVNQEISLVAVPCPSGGIYYVGATTSTGSGDADPVLMKLDDDGQVLWARAIGGIYYDVAGAMAIAGDGGLVCAGSTRSFNGNALDDLYFFKTDTFGNMLWSKTYSTADLDIASAIIKTSDDGFAITGYVRAGLKRVLLIRTDQNGDTLFTRTYGGTSDDQGVELYQTPDGGFIITGKTFTQSLGESDILLMRVDAQGNLLWTKSFGETHWDEGAGIIKLQDGNYLISGSTISFGQGDFDILLLKTDTSGNILWGKTYGGDKTDASYTARENSDGSIVVSGYTNSMGYGHSLRLGNQNEMDGGTRGDDSTNVFLMKVNANGDTIWTRSYGDAAQDEAFHFSKMPDGGYLIPGFSTSYSNTIDSTQMMLIRTDSLGHSGCHEQNAHPIIDTTNFITQTLSFAQSGGITENIVTSNSLAWNVAAEDACLFIQVGEHEKIDFDLFPNPAVNSFAIRLPGTSDGSDAEPFSIHIYNLPGQNIYSSTGSGTAMINCETFVPGIYFIKISASAFEVTRKIIIQKN